MYSAHFIRYQLIFVYPAVEIDVEFEQFTNKVQCLRKNMMYEVASNIKPIYMYRFYVM